MACWLPAPTLDTAWQQLSYCTTLSCCPFVAHSTLAAPGARAYQQQSSHPSHRTGHMQLPLGWRYYVAFWLSGLSFPMWPACACIATASPPCPCPSLTLTPCLPCSYAAPDPSNRRSSLSTDFSFGMSEDSRNPNPSLPAPASQERLRQQQYMRQQFIQQQQGERRRNSEQQQQQQQQARQQWDGGNSIHDSPVRQNSSSSIPPPDKLQQLHSAPTR